MNVSKQRSEAPSGYFVDWISARLDRAWLVEHESEIPSDRSVELLCATLAASDKYERCKPRFGYKMAWRGVDNGLVVQFHPARPDMGVNVIATGQTLQRLSWRAVIDCLRTYGAYFARIDLSMDIRDGCFNLSALAVLAKDGFAATKARKVSYVSSSTGDTLYVGSRTAEKFLRIYDKGAQQGGERGIWFRCELECKGAAANFVADIVGNGEPGLAKNIIGGYFSCPSHKGVTLALNTGEERIRVQSEKKRPNTESWLLGTVASTMASVCVENPGFMDDFMAAVNEFARQHHN